MISFKDFLFEDDILASINALLSELSDDEIDEFGYVIYYEFFDTEEENPDEFEVFALSDVQEMLSALDPETLEIILELLQEEQDDPETPEDESEYEVQEGVNRRMLSANRNRKRRKFMSNSRATMRRTAAARKRKNRQTRQARKRYYRANKQKISAYQKSRREAIKSGKHFVKKRRQTG